MSRFSKVLNDLIGEHSFSATGLSEAAGIQRLTISRLRHGETRPGREHLEALLLAFTEPNEQFRLLKAHILDEMPEPSLKNLEISLKGETFRESSALPIILDRLPKTVQDAIRYLIPICEEIPPVGDIFIDLARAHGWQPGILPKKASKKPGQYPPSKKE